MRAMIGIAPLAASLYTQISKFSSRDSQSLWARRVKSRLLKLAGVIGVAALLVGCETTNGYQQSFLLCDDAVGQCYQNCENFSDEDGYGECQASCEREASICFDNAYNRYQTANISYSSSIYLTPWFGNYASWYPDRGFVSRFGFGRSHLGYGASGFFPGRRYRSGNRYDPGFDGFRRTVPTPRSRDSRRDRPRSDRFRDDDRSRSDRPRTDRPRRDRPRRDRPRSDRPRSDRPRGDRPRNNRPGNGNAKPSGSDDNLRDRPVRQRPRSERPRARPPQGRPPQSRPPQSRPPASRPPAARPSRPAARPTPRPSSRPSRRPRAPEGGKRPSIAPPSGSSAEIDR